MSTIFRPCHFNGVIPLPRRLVCPVSQEQLDAPARPVKRRELDEQKGKRWRFPPDRLTTLTPARQPSLPCSCFAVPATPAPPPEWQTRICFCLALVWSAPLFSARQSVFLRLVRSLLFSSLSSVRFCLSLSKAKEAKEAKQSKAKEKAKKRDSNERRRRRSNETRWRRSKRKMYPVDKESSEREVK